MSSNTLTSIPIFAPTQISNCVLWLDAADTSTVTLSGGNLTRWNDKSGLNNYATNTGTVLYTQGLNGLNVATFSNATATNNVMVTQTFSIDPILETYFYLIQFGATIGNYGISLASSHPTQFSYYIYFIKGASTLSIDVGQISVGTIFSSSSFDNTTTGPINQTGLISFQRTGATTGEIRYNGTLLTTTNGGLSGGFYQPTGYRLGANLTTGSIGEHIIYNSSISTAQRQQVEGYLAWKWGIQSSLPSNHPYRNTPIYATTTLPPQFRSNLATIPMAPSSAPFSFFNPVSVSGCQMWLDGADSSSLTLSGTSVTTWKDKSGNVNNANTGTSSPIWNSSDYSITFNGTDQNLLFTNPSSLVVNKPFIFFIVEKRPSLGGYLLSGFTEGNNQNLMFGYVSSTQVDFEYYGSGKTSLTTVPAFTSASAEPIRIWTGNYTGSTRSISLNGGALSVSGAFSQNLTAWVNGGIGRVYGGTIYSQYYNIKVYEVLFYNTISTVQQQQVEGYLAWKWGIPGSLPASHPYKNTPPGLSIPVVPTSRQMSTRGFSPLNFSGCTLWLDGQDINGNGSTLSTGATISTWVDKSSSGINLTGTNVTYTYDSSYRVNAPTFNGSSSIFNQANTALYPLNNVSTYSIISVARRLSTNSYQAVYFAPGSTNLLIYRFTNINLSEWYLGPAADVYLNNTSTNGDGINELITQVSGTATGYINGNRIGSNTTRTSSGQLNFVLGRQDGNPFLNGYIYEVIVYNTAVSTAQRQNIEGYLAWKWNLVGSLPATHPYKLFPPPPS